MYQPDLGRTYNEDPLLAKLTPEEIQILKRCNSEATRNRGIPIGVVSGLAMYFAIKNGYIKSKMPFATVTYITAAGFMGFMLGRMSYVIKCVNSSLPKSTFDRLNKQILVVVDDKTQQQQPINQLDDKSDEIKRHDGISLDIPSSNNFDSSAPSYSDDNVPNMKRNDSNQRYYHTYDELKEKNRRQYQESAKTNIYRPQSTNYFWDEPRRFPLDDEPREDSPPAPEEKPRYRRKTKYGDDLE